MAIIMGCSIDLSKVDESKVIQGKNGARYYNFDVVLNDTPNQYGKDVSLKVSQTKEERAEKEPVVYIGNGKKLWEGNN